MEVPKEIQRHLDNMDNDLKRKKDRLLSWIDSYHVAEEVAEMFEGCWTGVYLTDGSMYDGVILHLNLKSVNDAGPILIELGKRGYNQKGAPQNCNHNALMIWDCGIIHIDGHLTTTDEPGTCRMVKVGVKEEPVYEMRCD